MSKLIDDFYNDLIESPTTQFINGWYIAKPVQFYGFWTYKQKLKDAIRILRGKSIAVHYKVDAE